MRRSEGETCPRTEMSPGSPGPGAASRWAADRTSGTASPRTGNVLFIFNKSINNRQGHLHARVVRVLRVEVGLQGDGLPVAACDEGHTALDQHALHIQPQRSESRLRLTFWSNRKYFPPFSNKIHVYSFNYPLQYYETMKYMYLYIKACIHPSIYFHKINLWNDIIKKLSIIILWLIKKLTYTSTHPCVHTFPI